jgi:dTDP-4-amino-4,6-dideoxygalactose transaminase
MNRASAFDVVRQFEEALAEYTGAPHVVTVDSCTNALFLSLLWWGSWIDRNFVGLREAVEIPRRTYVGVAQSVKNAGYKILWHDEPWSGWYPLHGTPIWDSARRFRSGMYRELASPGVPGAVVCVSFQAAKHLPIGRGGAILTDNAETAAWLRRARFDGRTAGDNDATILIPGYHMYLSPPEAARGLWLLSWLPEHNEDLPNDDYPDLSLIFGEKS